MQEMINIKLYLGHKINNPDRDDVSYQMLQRFLDEVVTPAYPGFTLYNAEGNWKGKREQTTVLEIFVPVENCVDNKRLLGKTFVMPLDIVEIKERYRARFDQESVMVSFSPAIVKF
jgi:hypothetical protein